MASTFRRSLAFILLMTCVFWLVPGAAAQTSPTNNKVGINVIRHFETRYLKAASQIVNSSGGDWGYVGVLLLTEDRQDPARVQRLLDDANQFHLIPIIRLGTRMEGNMWVKPGPMEPAEWKRFFGQLQWHFPAVYLEVGNEVNLGFEWGGDVNPKEYARYLESFINTFADQKSRFKILNAAMDLSNATKPGVMMDDFEYLAAMRAEVPGIFGRLDGWASNPYHFFEDRGIRYTYRGYSQELDFIGLDLPVFVTESYVGFVDDPVKIADYYQKAFSEWMKDSRVVAATPHFFNPEAKLFWMFDADAEGNPINLSVTAQRLAQMPKTLGSGSFIASAPSLGSVSGVASLIPMSDFEQDYAIAGGHFYTQANGQPAKTSRYGFRITNEGGVPFWSEFQRLGGVQVLGYPVSRRFFFDGFISQATQKFILQWRPDRKEVWFVNVFDLLYERGKDDWLLSFRQTPPHPGSAADKGLSWDQIYQRHWQILDRDPDVKKLFESSSNPLLHYGLPISFADMGNVLVLRAQRAVFQKWKEDVPWAPKGYITVANGGDIAKEAGVVPLDATIPEPPPAPLATMVPVQVSTSVAGGQEAPSSTQGAGDAEPQGTTGSSTPEAQQPSVPAGQG